jgi:hypothetical protein
LGTVNKAFPVFGAGGGESLAANVNELLTGRETAFSAIHGASLSEIHRELRGREPKAPIRFCTSAGTR